MQSDELDFALPAELIAQEPTPQRSGSRLLHYVRRTETLADRGFSDLPDLLRPGDLLVFNDVRVAPARLALRRLTGGRVEGLFLDEIVPGRWRVMLRDVGTPDQPLPLAFAADPSIAASVLRRVGDEYELQVNTDRPAAEVLEAVGRMPLPPYIRRDKVVDPRDAADRERYQTVFARAGLAVAAPTAALHFEPGILHRLEQKGVRSTFVTLDVGMGTFKPLTSDTLEGHAMHVERYRISADAADAINAAGHDGRRIVAVGTTSARVLESQTAGRPVEPHAGQTGIFIYPPYEWKRTGALITNFHLPRSTLIALVAAFVGLEPQRRIYRHAIEKAYRFFSYGDSSLLE